MPRTNNGYWFKHFIDASVDEKIVAIATETAIAIERVSFCWFRVLESAARINDKGKFDLTPASIAWMLRCDVAEIETVFRGFEQKRMIAGGKAINWAKRQAQPKTSNAKAAAESRARKTKGLSGQHPLTPAYSVSASNPATPQRIPESESESDQNLKGDDSARERASEDGPASSDSGLNALKLGDDRALEVDCRALVGGLPVSVDTNFIPILRLLDAGMTRDDILGGIREATELRQIRARSWSVFDRFIREKAKDRLERARPNVVIDLKPRAGPGSPARDGRSSERPMTRESNVAATIRQLQEIRAEDSARAEAMS